MQLMRSDVLFRIMMMFDRSRLFELQKFCYDTYNNVCHWRKKDWIHTLFQRDRYVWTASF